MFDPRLEKLRAAVRTVDPAPEIIPAPAPCIPCPDLDLDAWLESIGCQRAILTRFKEDVFLLEVAKLGNLYVWIDFSHDEEATCCVARLMAMPLETIDGELYPESILAQVADRELGENCRKLLVENFSLDGSPVEQIQSWLDLAFGAVERMERSDLAARESASRLEGHLVGLGYPVVWSSEVAFDLERVKILGTDRRYYVDSREQIGFTPGGTFFVDLLGRQISLSSAVPYIVEPLTFRSVAELASEDPSLVIEHRVVLEGWVERWVHGLARHCLFYDPDMARAKIVYEFQVPIPSIADTLTPPLVLGQIPS